MTVAHPQIRRRGFTLVEMTIATTLLGITFGFLGLFVSRWNNAQKSAEQRIIALRVAENLLERRLADPKREPRLPDGVSERLQDVRAEWSVGIVDDLGFQPATVVVSWTNSAGSGGRPSA